MDDKKEISVSISDSDLYSFSTDILDTSDTIDTSGITASGAYSININTSQFNGTSAPNFYYGNNIGNIGIGTTYPSNSLQVTGDAEFEGDVKIKGKSILTTLETIEKRLAILQPDPEKLEHFEALQKAYQHYKTLEALCEVPKKEIKE